MPFNTPEEHLLFDIRYALQSFKHAPPPKSHKAATSQWQGWLAELCALGCDSTLINMWHAYVSTSSCIPAWAKGPRQHRAVAFTDAHDGTC